ncbi:hypothetical protein LF1_37670 [Rubripirellula obstinata]|uniref:Ice-binding protein C-terminal domain-containing protein n=1 Tax=Rubripirellula obstinata TaxID=406547 RepID=A0A5B1CLR1_9BACT|nr:choice-of-anchor M domain-containing protein [Rubripirellula obstinata]KAA1261221.1 hypothetical protein LF1_37670 [Rubripirellula obstinata]
MNHLITKAALIYCVSAVIALSLNNAEAALTEYSAGHADIRVAYRSGSDIDLVFEFGEGAVLDDVVQTSVFEADTSDYFVRVPSSTMTNFSVPLGFLGLESNQPLWMLPRSQDAGVPFLGIASHNFGSSGFASLTLSMTDVDGPGNFALWQVNNGALDVFWQTAVVPGQPPNDNMLNVGLTGHDHYQFGFTQEGVYDIQLTASGFQNGNLVESDPTTFRFVVGDLTAIPEPSSLALISFGALGWYARRRRKPQTVVLH